MISIIDVDEGYLVPAIEAASGKIITAMQIIKDFDQLVIRFDDGMTLVIADEGQQCCESRYISTDDDLAYFVGAKFLGAEVRDGPSQTPSAEDHTICDTQFLIGKTSRGEFTVVCYNAHNGYYAGFELTAILIEEGE